MGIEGYKAYQDAADIIVKARMEATTHEMSFSALWEFMKHAEEYCVKTARQCFADAFRAED